MMKLELASLGGAKWALSDFRTDAREALEKALDAPGDFDTDWYEASKSLNYGKIERKGDWLYIHVKACMDSLEYLVEDALAELGLDAPEGKYDEIYEAAQRVGITDSCVKSNAYPARGVTMLFIECELNSLEEEAEEECAEMYRALCALADEMVPVD